MEPNITPPSGELSPGGCLLRLFWMGFGNAALGFSAMHLALADDIRTAGALFGASALALFAARALDILRFGGLTTNNLPATRADLVRYGAKLGLVSVALALAALTSRGALG